MSMLGEGKKKCVFCLCVCGRGVHDNDAVLCVENMEGEKYACTNARAKTFCDSCW